MLAMKRARDRRAQQAMRDRTKAEIAALQEQVMQLQERLRAQDSVYSQERSRLLRQNDHLRQRIRDLQLHPLSSQTHLHHWSRGYRPTNSNARISLDQSILASLFAQKETTSLRPVEGRLSLGSQDPYNGISPSSIPDHLRLPLHVPPLNPSDRIVQPFVQKMRALVCGQDTGTISSELSDPQSPLPALSPSAVQASISRVMSDIISTYSEFNTMSMRMACIMSASSALTVCQTPTVPPPR